MGTRRIESPGLLCGARRARRRPWRRGTCACVFVGLTPISGRGRLLTTDSSRGYFYPTSTPSPRSARRVDTQQSDFHADAGRRREGPVPGARRRGPARPRFTPPSGRTLPRTGAGSAPRRGAPSSGAPRARRTRGARPDASWRSARVPPVERLRQLLVRRAAEPELALPGHLAVGGEAALRDAQGWGRGWRGWSSRCCCVLLLLLGLWLAPWWARRGTFGSFLAARVQVLSREF